MKIHAGFLTYDQMAERKTETSVLIIYTGCTIGMVHDSLTGLLIPIDFRHITDHVPVIRN